MAEKNKLVKAGGVFTFNPKENAPSFVLGTIVITLDDFWEFLKGEGKEHVTDYKGKKQIKLNVTSMKEGRGILVAVDTWKPTGEKKNEEPFNGNSEPTDDLPFALFLVSVIGSLIQFI